MPGQEDEKMPATGAERRKHFRVDDKVLIDYKLVTDLEIRAAMNNLALVDNAELSAMTTLRRLESDLQDALGKLQRNQKETARCLDILNNKINTAISLLPGDPNTDMNMSEREVCQCNLSASGIAFTTREAIPVGARMRLRMVMLPDYYHIVTYARVMRCEAIDGEDEDGFTHVVGTHFVHILDRYKDILVRRSLQREIQERREERKRANDDPGRS